jgi:CHAT domain-containing protein
VVVATQWNVPDVFGYIFTALFYERLNSRVPATQAFGKSLVDMYELTKERAAELLQEIEDETTKERLSGALRASAEAFPLRNPYFLGMFQCYSLLPT